MLRNFISNAIKYSFTGGTIDINTIQENGRIQIAIADHGTGMDADMVAAFNQSKTEHVGIESTPGTQQEKGTGLGC